jgi:hypothetical protein
VGGIKAVPPFEFFSLPSSSSSSGFVLTRTPTTQTQHVFSCVLSSKIVLSLLGLSSSVLIFWGFSVIVVLISGALVERECVDAEVDEGGP